MKWSIFWLLFAVLVMVISYKAMLNEPNNYNLMLICLLINTLVAGARLQQIFDYLNGRIKD